MRVILQTWCQIQGTCSSLRYANCSSGHIQCNYSYAFAGFNIQVNVSALLLDIFRHFDARYTENWCQIQHTSLSIRYGNCGPGHVQCNYCSIYSGFSIKLNIYALILVISRPFNARYTANLVPNIAHTLQFTLWELWSRPYTI
jgi:hypothetical protein